ncbi:hypothetical protein ACIRYZ_27280 [Kitasatospora sp. NPDC101155]|uniref:hypothetical protein n=1 Tax=Kitasatospora sp. NPDC101155 TaxID=3364097 RepID=UPI0038190066
MSAAPRSTAPDLHTVEGPSAPATADTTTVDSVPSGYAIALAAEPGVHDPAVVAALAVVPRHHLIPRAYLPLGEERPTTRWRLLDADGDRAAYRGLVYSMDQVVVQLADQPAAEHTVGAVAHIAPDGVTVTEWGPRALWQLAEDVHERWVAAGRPDTYRLELTDQEQRVIGGPGLHWVLPL